MANKISGLLPLPRKTLSRRQIFILLFILIGVIVVCAIIFGSLFAYHNSSQNGAALAVAIVFVVIAGSTYTFIAICYMSCGIFLISIVKKNKSTDRELQFLNAMPFYTDIQNQLRQSRSEMIIISTKSDYQSKKWAKGQNKSILNSVLISNFVQGIAQEVKQRSPQHYGEKLVTIIIGQEYSLQHLTQSIDDFLKLINDENGQVIITMKSTIQNQFVQAVNERFQIKVFEYGERLISQEEFKNCVQCCMFTDESVKEEYVNQVYQKLDKTKLSDIQDQYEAHFNYMGRKFILKKNGISAPRFEGIASYCVQNEVPVLQLKVQISSLKSLASRRIQFLDQLYKANNKEVWGTLPITMFEGDSFLRHTIPLQSETDRKYQFKGSRINPKTQVGLKALHHNTMKMKNYKGRESTKSTKPRANIKKRVVQGHYGSINSAQDCNGIG